MWLNTVFIWCTKLQLKFDIDIILLNQQFPTLLQAATCLKTIHNGKPQVYMITELTAWTACLDKQTVWSAHQQQLGSLFYSITALKQAHVHTSELHKKHGISW